MDIEKLGINELNILILMEEFRYWDAKRNQVPDVELEKISIKISSLKLQKPRSLFNDSNSANLS